MKNIAQYSSLAAAFIAAGNTVSGQIEYTNLDPDAVRHLGNTHFVTYEPLVYLDIDNDGPVDIFFEVYFGLGTTFTNQVSATVVDVYGNWSILLTAADSFPRALKYGDVIGAAGNWGEFSASAPNDHHFMVRASFYGENCDTLSYPTESDGNFYNRDGRFIGIRKIVGGDYHYGWVRLSTLFHNMCPEPLNDALTLTIHDYAFNNTPNESLSAGETGLNCNAPFPLSPVAFSPTVTQVKWQAVEDAIKYKIRYRAVGAATWNNAFVDAPKSAKKLTGLSCDTQYEWCIASNCDGGATYSAFSDLQTFTTMSCRAEDQMQTGNGIDIFPNPVKTMLTLQLNEISEPVKISLYDINGRLLKSFIPDDQTILQIDMSELSAGFYIIEIAGESFTEKKTIIKS